jgi:aminopeptidase N
MTDTIQVRQAVAITKHKIPEDFRVQYESLLDDKSYQTQEIALFYLWNNFPEQRLVYLEKSKDWIGFSDYNLKHYGCHLRYLPQNIKWIKRFL